MKTRTPAQWHSLFAEQTASGLSIAAFCREHALCSKNFSRRRKQLQKNTTTAPPSFIPVTTKIQNQSPMLEIHHTNLTVKIPLSVSASWLSEFIQQLQR
jgi:hypothetical protein